MKLNIGAGGNLKPTDEGWINIDARELDGIDLVLDLEVNDLPYSDNSVDEVNMQDFLEHLNKFRQKPFLRELFRVMQEGSKAFIQIPHLKILAKRYCGVLENPTDLQTDLDGEQFAASLYGGQEYGYNFHKWGYDEESLIKQLEEIGFVVRWIRGDGGANLHCYAARPYNNILIPLGGGIGDILQVYLSSPASRSNYEGDNHPPPDEFPTANVDASLWLKRLAFLKRMYPAVKVKIVIVSPNKVAKEIFEHHPFIDSVELIEPGKAPVWYRYVDDEGYMHVEGTEFMHEKLVPDPVRFYMSEEEYDLCEAAKNLGKYIVIHPFAGAVERVVISERFCRRLIDELIDEFDYHVIVVGKQSVFNGVHELPEKFRYEREGLTSLVNKVSINASAQLTLGASGFIGTHSCMILCAWYARIPSVCLVPPNHDGGQPWSEFFSDEMNPTTWGSRQPFNGTIVVENEDIEVNDVMNMLMRAGLKVTDVGE